jgi:signal transduction histidine kinase/FixJ family two-component response regulator
VASNRFIYLILSAFVAGNILLIFVQYNSAKNIDNLITGNKKLQHELRVDNQLRELERDLLSAEIKIRGAVATNDSSYFEGVDLLIAEAKGYLDSLKEVSEHDSTIRNINRLYEVADEKLILKNRILDSFHQKTKLSAESFKTIMQQRKLTNLVNNVSRKIYDSRRRLIDSLSISVNNSGLNARSWGTAMIIAVLVSEAALFWYIINRLLRQNQLILQLDASEKKVREVSMIKENFLANMSHEIRTPMNAILGFTNLLKTKNRDPDLMEFVESIQKSGENLLTIINDILDLSKIEAGMMRIESVPFSIHGLFQSIQTLFTEKINEKGLSFSKAIDETIPETLLGDATRLTQILVNMIGNAVKFTSEGNIHVAISNKGMDGNKIRLGFVISDTGIGIAKEKLSGIFERFRQAEDSTTRKFGGTGLGLSIAKDLVVLQNGEIHVESTLGEGTTFRFTIPYEIATKQLTVSKSKEVAGFDYPASRDIQILVVEDNVMNQNLLKHLFNGWKFSFDIVNNGFEALEKLKVGKYNLVLMDIQMPGMDGYAATQEIRLKLKQDIAIIAMTAHAFPGEREKCLSYGMNEYIAKPINERELYRLILQFTGTGRDAQVSNNAIIKKDSDAYHYINLQYLREISDGDKKYEKLVTSQFIEAIPLDLAALESAFRNMDLTLLRQTVHNMKTNVSVMGLTEKLQSHLDELEYESLDEAHVEQIILSIKTICMNALPEARHFYSTL